MPDRYGDPSPERDEPLTDEQRAFRANLHAIATRECGLCDDDGYRGSTVCDHQEHSTPAGRAAAKDMLRQALEKGA